MGVFSWWCWGQLHLVSTIIMSRYQNLERSTVCFPQNKNALSRAKGGELGNGWLDGSVLQLFELAAWGRVLRGLILAPSSE